MYIKEMVEIAHKTAVEKGWHDKEVEIPTRLMLIVSELSEAMEDLRSGKPVNQIQWSIKDSIEKPDGFPVELADVVVRIGDLCGLLGIDLEEAIKAKMNYNLTRPHRHGGKVF